jgi:selenocysteine lyase/cysteine desulfurase
MSNGEIQLLPDQRSLFDIPNDVAYLNCAYMSPLMHSVVEAGEKAVGRKQHPWEISAPDFFELPDRGRELFARLIGAAPAEVAIVPAASYGISLAALNTAVRPGQEILLLHEQFPSNVYPWRQKAMDTGGRVVTVQRPVFAQSWTQSIVDAINPQTAVVALPHCHWTDGSMIDLVEVGEMARRVGAALVIDATQSVGALPIDVGAVRPDYLVAAAYKWLLGPYSLGFVYAAPHRHEDRPLEQAWAGRKGAEDFARLVDYQDEYGPGMKRMDMGGASQLHLMPMAIRAMEQILDWGVENIAGTLAHKTREIAERAASLGLSSVPEEFRAGHFLGLGFEGGVPARLLEQLAARKVYVSVRGDSMRITPHLYNDRHDVDRLLEALESELK